VADALKIDPTNASLRVLSGKLAIEQGQLELAQNELELARKYSPNDPEAYYLAGVVCQRWQKPDRAYEFYTAASDKAPFESMILRIFFSPFRDSAPASSSFVLMRSRKARC